MNVKGAALLKADSFFQDLLTDLSSRARVPYAFASPLGRAGQLAVGAFFVPAPTAFFISPTSPPFGVGCRAALNKPVLRAGEAGDCLEGIDQQAQERGGWPTRRADILGMIRPLIASALLATTAHAETLTFHPDPDPTNSLIATIRIHNDEGSGTGNYTFDIDQGEIVLRYITFPNGPCLSYPGKTGKDPSVCADTVQVISWPEGVTVHPFHISIEENTTGEIRVFVFAGV